MTPSPGLMTSIATVGFAFGFAFAFDFALAGFFNIAASGSACLAKYADY